MRHVVSTPSPGAVQLDHRHKPPISFVLIREQTPPSASGTQSVCSVESSGTFHGSSPTSHMFANTSIIPSGASFRLQPRGRSVSSPFSSASSRGQKRNAHCLGSGSSKELSGSTDELLSFTDSPQTYGERHPVVEMGMESLSIKSPMVQHTILDLSGSSSPSTRSCVPSRSFLGTSFISCASSPAGGLSYPRARGDSIGYAESSKIPSSPPPSSVKSSPRFAPLAVVQKPASVAGTPIHRPPRHGGPSSLIFSLDGSGGKAGADLEHNILHTPSKSQASVMYSPPVSTASCISTEYTPTYHKRGSKSAAPEYIPIIATPVAMKTVHTQMSPSTPASIRSAHQTPLPSIRLTPRSTPRSSSSYREFSLYPSPHSARDMGLLPIELVGHSSESRTFPGQASNLDNGDSHAHSRYLSSSSPTSRPSYLPLPERYDDQSEMLSCRSPAKFRLPQRGPMRSSIDHDGDLFPPVHTTSLLSSPRTRGFLHDMVHEQARAAALDADGSLSDPDEEVPFVLTDPSALAEEREFCCDGPARQKQRLSYNSTEPSSLRSSSMSFSPAHASKRSLLGMSFIPEDSATSLSRQDSGIRQYSFQLNALKRTNDEEPNSPAFTAEQDDRSRSDRSISSTNLAWDPSVELTPKGYRKDHDLVTPPAMDVSTRSCPSAEGRDGSPHWTPSARRVCISGADVSSVNETIAMMAFESGHNHGYSPQTKCHS